MMECLTVLCWGAERGKLLQDGGEGVCVPVCACACACACVHVCMCACVHALFTRNSVYYPFVSILLFHLILRECSS